MSHAFVKTSAKQAGEETERKCLWQKDKERKTLNKTKKEAEHKSLWQNYKES